MFHFGRSRGGTWRDGARLFFYAVVKPALVFRGKARYEPARILNFSFKLAANRRVSISAHDNGLDVLTFAEFFSKQHQIIPPELPPLDPVVVYDLGANIGAASLFLAAHHPGARFYGFEPLPENHEICARNYQNLPQSRVFAWAVGSRSGSAPFRYIENDMRAGRLSGAIPGATETSTKRVDVEIVSIADLVTVKGLEPPDFIKIDVEGAELEVLTGLGEHADRVKWMLVETHGPELLASCLRWMLDNGFNVRHLHEAELGYASVWCSRSPGA